MLSINEIKQNLTKVRENIKLACEASGRNENDVTLTLAGKTISQEVLLEICENEKIIVGENRAQEFKEKYTDRLTWHFIGQLQTNKVKYVVGKTALVHSLDRLSLAAEIDRIAKRNNVTQDCLIEINMGSEILKGGIEIEELNEFYKDLKAYENICIKGLMTVMPICEKQQLMCHFDRINDVFCKFKKFDPCIDTLSMGMSNDYELAVMHGATLVRLGTAVFGKRL